jgi:hypothetical protein
VTDVADSALARVVFALLVAASFGAFFVTQRLKHTPTAVQGFKMTPFFSPTASTGRHLVERISFRIRRADRVTVTVVDGAGDDVATLGRREHPLGAYTRYSLQWKGRTDAGRQAPDGTYRIRVRLLRQGRSVLSPRSFMLDSTPPRPRITAVAPAGAAAATPGAGPPVLPRPGGGGVSVSFALDAGGGDSDAAPRDPQLLIYRTDVTPAQLVSTLPVAAGASSSTWDGTVNGGPPAAGTYLVAIRDRDAAGNVGSSPSLLPPRRTLGQTLPGRAGITVRYLGVQPPNAPAAAGSTAAFGVDARAARYRWTLRRVGAGRPRAHGSGTKPILSLRAPGGISGLYLLAVSSGPRSTTVPLAVQGPIRRRVLVVLPTITWVGREPDDEDGDGLPDTLDAGTSVPSERIFTAGLPADAPERVEPLLAFLDQNHLRYDLTTDLALAAAPSQGLAAHRGVLLPGEERWLPSATQSALRDFVHGGGRLASLVPDSLRGSVTVSAGRLTSPIPPGTVDAVGARLGPQAHGAASITEFQDSGQLSLFLGGNGRFTGYSDYEPTSFVGPESELLSSAVTDSGSAVIVGARLGTGVWMHIGLPNFAARLAGDPNSAALMRRTWQLLSGR